MVNVRLEIEETDTACLIGVRTAILVLFFCTRDCIQTLFAIIKAELLIPGTFITPYINQN